MKRLTVALLVVAAVLLTACGDSQSPADRTLHAAEKKLSDVRSGELMLSMLASSSGARRTSGVGFQVEGPFAVARAKGALPRGDLRYTRITGASRSTTRFVLTSQHAYAYVDGAPYRLRDVDVAGLRASGKGGGGLDGLDFTDWISDPVVKAGPVVGGTRTREITGKVDAVGALNDILGLAREFGASTDRYPAAIAESDAQTVRRAVRATALRLEVGRDDNLLRRFQLVVTMAVSQQDKLRAALKGLAGVRIEMDLAVKDVNRPVTITAPHKARPANELPSS